MKKYIKTFRRFLVITLVFTLLAGCFPVSAEAAALKSVYVGKYARVWLNVLGAVESGGMVYGERDYGCFAGPYNASPNEHACTGGAYQEYGDNLRQLLIKIQKAYPKVFKRLDTANIAQDMKHSWDSYAVTPGSDKGKAIIRIISSPQGKKMQDKRAIELLDDYLEEIQELGITNVRCGLFMAQCAHLGGFAAVKRVVERASNKNNMASLKRSLYLDQKDYSNSYQIGDAIYKNRHEYIFKWLRKYIPANAEF